MRRGVVLAVVVWACSVPGVRAAAQGRTTLYRYSVLTATYDTDYRGPMAAGAKPAGGYFKVERDAQGRIARVTGMNGSTEDDVTTFHYPGASRYADSAETLTQGQRTGMTLYQRDGQGRVTREDSETAEGKLTGYTLVSWTPGHAVVRGYDATDRLLSRAAMDFSPAGVHVHRMTYHPPEADVSYVERQTDENTGLSLWARQVTNGKVDNTRKFTYDGNGDETRMDAYGPDGDWYAGAEYKDNQLSRKLYKMGNGQDWVFTYSFDEKQWPKEVALTVNAKPILTLKYDLETDGTVKRTLAIGADGTLWGEYPAPVVREVAQDGQPPGRTDGILHHPAPWW